LAADDTPNYTGELGQAIHTYLARSRARLMLVQLEDVAGESEQANLPGTTEDHPNWQRRLSLRLEDILAGLELRHLAISVNAARPGTDARHRAEPYGGRRRRQRMVARCPRMGRGVALRRLFRHQLGPGARGSEGPGVAAGARRPIRCSLGARRDRAALRAVRG